MAVNFSKGLPVLLEDLRRLGFKPSILRQVGRNRVLAAEIRIQDGLLIHWDRDSRSLWTEGPWPDAARLEARLDRLYHGTLFHRAAKEPKVVASVIAGCALLVASYVMSTRSTGPGPDPVRPTQTALETSMGTDSGAP